jgi:L-threonylcarbamoyladenylate synthase
LAHADIILVEALPQDNAWQGVNDRLQRAAFDSRDVLQRLVKI